MLDVLYVVDVLDVVRRVGRPRVTEGGETGVSGAIGLLLGKYPTLSRRDVSGLLAASSVQVQVDPHDDDWTPRNSRHIVHSHNYGWGLLNVANLLDHASNWTSWPAEQHCDTGIVVLNRTLPDGSSSFSWLSDMPTLNCLTNPNGAAIDYVETVEVLVRISHPSRGDLSIMLTDPSGVTSILAAPHVDINRFPSRHRFSTSRLSHISAQRFPSAGWTYSSVRHWGQTMRGLWSLQVADAIRNGQQGVLQNVRLIVYGHKMH